MPGIEGNNCQISKVEKVGYPLNLFILHGGKVSQVRVPVDARNE